MRCVARFKVRCGELVTKNELLVGYIRSLMPLLINTQLMG